MSLDFPRWREVVVFANYKQAFPPVQGLWCGESGLVCCFRVVGCGCGGKGLRVRVQGLGVSD